MRPMKVSSPARAILLGGWVIRDEDGFDCHRLTEVTPPHADEETAWVCERDQQERCCQVCGVEVEFWATFCRSHFAEAMRAYKKDGRGPHL